MPEVIKSLAAATTAALFGFGGWVVAQKLHDTHLRRRMLVGAAPDRLRHIA